MKRQLPAALLLLPLAAAWLSPAGSAPPFSNGAVLLGRSLLLALLAAAISLGLGTLLAALLACRNLPLRPLWRPLLLVPLLVPPYLNAIAWVELCRRLGLGADFPNRLPMAALVLGLGYVPLVLYPGLIALERLGASLHDAGRLARGEAATWRRVALPLAAPFLLTGAALAFLLALGEFGVPSLLGQNTVAVEVFALIDGYHDLAAAARAALPLWLVAVAVVLLLARRAPAILAPQPGPPARLRLPDRLRLPAGLLVTALATLLTGLPLTVLLAMAGRPQAFLLAWWEAGADILSSLAVCFPAALLAMLLGLLVGRSGPLPLVLLVSPPALLGLGWLRLDLLPEAVYAAGGLLALGLAWRFLALPGGLLQAAFQSQPSSLAESARLVRARPWRALYLDPHRRTWRLAFSLVFAFMMGELTLSLLLTPAGMGTLSQRIFNLYHYGRPELVGALALTLIALVLTPLVVDQALAALEPSP